MHLAPTITSLIVFLYAYLRGIAIAPWCLWAKVALTVVLLLTSQKCLICGQIDHSFIVRARSTHFIIHLLEILNTFQVLVFLLLLKAGLLLLELAPENSEEQKNRIRPEDGLRILGKVFG